MNTVDVNEYLAELERKGREVGLAAGLARAILLAYEARFGAPPQPIVEALRQTKDDATLQRWITVVASGSAEDVAAAIRPAVAPAQRPAVAPARNAPPKRRAGSSRRTATAR